MNNKLSKVSPMYDKSGKPDLNHDEVITAEALMNEPRKEGIKQSAREAVTKEGNLIHAENSFGINRGHKMKNEVSTAEKIREVVDKYMNYCETIKALNAQGKRDESQALGEKLVNEIDFHLGLISTSGDKEIQASYNKLSSVKEHIKNIANIITSKF